MDKRKILVIEDSADQRMLLRHTLDIYLPGVFEIIECDNAREGLDLMVSQSPVCIVLDYMLHGPSGMTFLSEMDKDHPDHPPVIFYSAAMSESLRRNAKALGASVCLEKNQIRGGDIPQIIREVLE